MSTAGSTMHSIRPMARVHELEGRVQGQEVRVWELQITGVVLWPAQQQLAWWLIEWVEG